MNEKNQSILAEWNTLWGKKPFRVCLMVNAGEFMLHNSDGRSVIIDRNKAIAWLRANSDITKIHSNIEKHLPEYYN
jgi:hypothetical protein